MSAGELYRSGTNSREIRVGDTVLLRQKFLNEVGADGRHGPEAWAWSPGIVIDLMEQTKGYLMFEVMFECEVSWFDDYELKLVEEEVEDVRNKA